MAAKQRFQIPFSLAAALTFVLAGLAIAPGLSVIVTGPLAILFLVFGVSLGFVKKPGFVDIFLVPVVLILTAIVFLAAFGVIIKRIDFFTLIIAGIVADVIISFGTIARALKLIKVARGAPFVGRALGGVTGVAIGLPSIILSILVFMIVSSIVGGGIGGFVIGSIASSIALLPITPPGIVTIIFIVVKVLLG